MTRAQLARRAASLRARGLLYRQIADAMGISLSYAQDLVTDPDGLKVRARKASYRGVCEDCGGPTDGSNGREAAPALCALCTAKRREAQHGTYSKYQRGGCRCDDCRRAHRDYMRHYRSRKLASRG